MMLSPMAMSDRQILVLGGRGQVGMALTSQLQNASNGAIDVLSPGSSECDITDASQLAAVIKSCRPDTIVNCAAYTAVDLAETEREEAFAVNETGVRHLVDACADSTRLIHLSTDFVFDGTGHKPYTTEDRTAPLSCYGASKLAGERVLQEQMPDQSMIIRSSWVYGVYGNNFVKTMLRLMSTLEEISVVEDQIGAPTSATSLAVVISRIVSEGLFTPGLYHWCDSGDISWYGFALEIQKQALELGLLDRKIPVYAIPSEAYPQAAKRPAYSVLDSTRLQAILGMEPRKWQSQLHQILSHL